MFTRRGATGLIASSVLLAGSAKAQSGIVLRQSASAIDAGSPEMEALRSAIPAMRQSGFWDNLVRIHALNWRQHHSWLFLPWHRAFLFQFERAVRRLTYDGFRMPYLDWDADRIPAMLYEPPFAHDGRTHGPDDSMRDFQGMSGRFWQSAPRPFDDFFGTAEFGGDDESYGHNLIHIFVGGDMGNISTAPRDPLFWFHHANVDRLWWHWDRQYGCASADCYPSVWQSQRVSGIVSPDGAALDPVPISSLLSTTALGYDYQSAPMVMMAAPPPLAEKAAPRVARPVYSTTLRLLGRPSQSTTVSLPRALLLDLFTASRADVDAPLFVRSSGTAAHEIRISMLGRSPLGQERIFAMPMGGMGASYVKNIGDMLASLAKGLSSGAAAARLANEPVALRIEALALDASAAGAVLTEASCRIAARTWV